MRALRVPLLALMLAVPATTRAQDDAPATPPSPYTHSGRDSAFAESLNQNPNKPTTAHWDSLTKGDAAFGYRNEVEYVKPEKPKAEKPKETTNWLLRFIEKIFEFLTSDGGKVFLWCLLIAIVGYILYRVLAGDSSGFFTRRRSVDGGDAGSIDDEDLYGANWQRLMDEAIQRGDTRAAIRCSYMLLLQKLEDTGRIQYRQDKTNAAYASTLR